MLRYAFLVQMSTMRFTVSSEPPHDRRFGRDERTDVPLVIDEVPQTNHALATHEILTDPSLAIDNDILAVTIPSLEMHGEYERHVLVVVSLHQNEGGLPSMRP
jgi:hypothetical protein